MKMRFELVKIAGNEDKHTIGVKVRNGYHSRSISPFDHCRPSHTELKHPVLGRPLIVENAKEWYKTSNVERINSDTTIEDERTVVFETETGSTYKWIQFG